MVYTCAVAPADPTHLCEGEQTVKAYVISDVEIVDRAVMERYRALAESTIAQYGGRYLARGGAIETLEGDWSPQAIVVVEFPSIARRRRA
jgi:uncharacterized protein (DUF1330 family)